MYSEWVNCDRCLVAKVRTDVEVNMAGWIRNWRFPCPLGHVSRTDENCIKWDEVDLCPSCHEELRLWWLKGTLIDEQI